MGYGLVLILALFVWGSAIIDLGQLGRASEAIVRENFQSVLAAENMIDAIERQDSGLLLLMLGYEEDGLTQFHQNEAAFLEWLGRAKGNITLENEAQTLQMIEDEYLAYLAAASQLRELLLTEAEAAHSTRSEQAPDAYHEAVLPKFKQVHDASINLRDMNDRAMIAASERAHRVSTRATWSIIVVGVIAVGLGLAFSLILSSILTRPLQEMTAAAERIADGDYDVTLTTTSKDELGRLARQIMTMSDKLKAFHQLNVNRLIAEKQRGEAIIQSISDGLIVVDADYRIIAINPTATQIFAQSIETAAGKHFFDVVQNQTLYDAFKNVMETGQPLLPDQEQAALTHTVHGHLQYFNLSITPIKRQEQEQPLGMVALLQDVTKFKELDRLKDEFVMTASHELRTPLTGMIMSVNLLMESAQPKLSEPEQTLLEAAREDAHRLRAMVNDLLDLSKIKSERIEMDMEPVNAALLVEKAAAAFTVQADKAVIELSWQIPEDLPPVKADPNKIAWVLTNLIGNALRYTEAGGHIRLSAKALNDAVALSVSDDGAGISLAYQSKIFDKFAQVESGKTVGGSGLGLAICKKIVNAHGGTIWVDSALGEGSTFTFTLPICVSSENNDTL
jgi:NtrC-family two-component system sensor histidine kinase KinB